MHGHKKFQDFTQTINVVPYYQKLVPFPMLSIVMSHVGPLLLPVVVERAS